MKTTNRIPLLAAAGLIVLSTAPARAGDIILNIVDAPGVGFNDPTPVAPVGGNSGTTLGEQRRIVFQTAASIWEAALAPEVDIVIQSSFSPLRCDATTGVLGSAGPIQIFANFPNSQWPNSWYPSALANHLAGTDLTAGPPDPGLLAPPFNDDIIAQFNGDIGVRPTCLTGFSWYNGLDNNANPVTDCATGIANTKGPYGFSVGIPRTIPEIRAAPLTNFAGGNAEGIDVMGGCYVQDMVNACETQGSPGGVSSCLGQVSQYLQKIGAISSAEGKAILACTKK